jgi:hypothetical protein
VAVRIFKSTYVATTGTTGIVECQDLEPAIIAASKGDHQTRNTPIAIYEWMNSKKPFQKNGSGMCAGLSFFAIETRRLKLLMKLAKLRFDVPRFLTTKLVGCIAPKNDLFARSAKSARHGGKRISENELVCFQQKVQKFTR